MSTWVLRWGYETAAKASSPCIYRLKSGGYLVATKVNGKKRLRVLPDANLGDASRALLELRETVENPERPLFQNFVVSLLKERMLKGTISSASTRERWREVLENYLIPQFGDLPVDEVVHLRIVEWTQELAGWIRYGKPSLKDPKKNVTVAPSTANGWLRVMSTICKVMTVRFDLPRNPFDGITFFREDPVYSAKEPNSLTPAKMRKWLDLAAEKYPQHYALMMLGFITGRRPGELRALHRTDVDWKNGVVTVQRSHSRGKEIANRTKTGVPVVLNLPKSMMAILKDHVAALPPGPMKESPLLFPSSIGGIRARSSLDKPFKALCDALGIDFRVTPRAMRRSFQDLMRDAKVSGLVTRNISGHKTEKMQDHYSTVNAKEQRAALERALEMMQ